MLRCRDRRGGVPLQGSGCELPFSQGLAVCAGEGSEVWGSVDKARGEAGRGWLTHLAAD